MMPFALTPDDGPPRLIRFVYGPHADEILNGALAVLEKEENLLIIDRERWLLMSKTDQHMLERTQAPVAYLDRHNRFVENYGKPELYTAIAAE